jgi:hypothetical protein
LFNEFTITDEEEWLNEQLVFDPLIEATVKQGRKPVQASASEGHKKRLGWPALPTAIFHVEYLYPTDKY